MIRYTYTRRLLSLLVPKHITFYKTRHLPSHHVNSSSNQFLNNICCNNSNNNSNGNKLFYTTTSSSTTTTDLKNNKLILKKFFLKVHPDLFFQYPKVKKTNDQSLRLLHSFLEEVKNERLSNKSYQLMFYYLDDNVYDVEQDIPYISVSFDIDLPHSGDTFHYSNRIYHHLKEAENQISTLFKSVGIKESFVLHSMLGEKLKVSSGAAAAGADINNNNVEYQSLKQFLKIVSTLAKEKAKQSVEEERRLDIMYTFFFMEHQVRILFNDHSIPTQQKSDLLKELEMLLSRLLPRNSNDELVEKIFYHNQQDDQEDLYRNMTDKRRTRLENMDQEDQEEEIDQFGESNFKGFGARVRGMDQATKQELFEPFGMFSGKQRDSWKGWSKIKAGYITPETSPKQDDSPLFEKLEGISIIFSNKSGVDLEGRLHLDSEKPKTWKKVLLDFKPSEILRNIKACKSRQAIEKELAKRLNIHSIFTEYNAQNNTGYLKLLDRLYIQTAHINTDSDREFVEFRHNIEEQGVSLEDFNNPNWLDYFERLEGLTEIGIKVISNEVDKKWFFDPALGVVYVPLDASLYDVIQFLKNNKERIINEHKRQKINNTNLAQLELTVKRKFRLSRLKKHPDLTMTEMVSCLRRLLYNHQPYLPYLNNVILIIGKENKVNQDGSVNIKWDFDI
ncbi:hypothetical protein CYY_005776 [Polysphondylium violaceum]|uniref:DUF4460 domain-containing protein n=1 Tax=Polysphondylium violaceum TaxID=133409 RepID=A0A8J4PUJ2_9MYCE|nr:hypothetical protein CYY_005776 [Polysphondylium violaceum]